MVKQAAIFGLLLCGAISMPGQPDKAASHKRENGTQSNPAVVAPNSQDKHGQSQQNHPQASGSAPTGNQTDERAAVGWYRDSNWWLVIIAGLTGGFICWQSWETRKSGAASQAAAIAARDSIKLQEAAMEQWVKVVNWRVLVIAPKIEAMTNGVVQVQFDIVNGSDLPLTMNNAQIVFYGHTVFNSGENVFVAPDTPYTVSVAIPLGNMEFQQYETTILTMRITGSIPHIGRLKKTIVQSFEGMLIFGKGKETYFMEQISMVPVELKADGGQNQGQKAN